MRISWFTSSLWLFGISAALSSLHERGIYIRADTFHYDDLLLALRPRMESGPSSSKHVESQERKGSSSSLGSHTNSPSSSRSGSPPRSPSGREKGTSPFRSAGGARSSPVLGSTGPIRLPQSSPPKQSIVSSHNKVRITGTAGQLRSATINTPSRNQNSKKQQHGVLTGPDQTVTVVGTGPARISIGTAEKRKVAILSPKKTRRLTLASNDDIDAGGVAFRGGSVTAFSTGGITSGKVEADDGGEGYIHTDRGAVRNTVPVLGGWANERDNYPHLDIKGQATRVSLASEAGVSGSGKAEAYAFRDVMGE